MKKRTITPQGYVPPWIFIGFKATSHVAFKIFHKSQKYGEKNKKRQCKIVKNIRNGDCIKWRN